MRRRLPLFGIVILVALTIYSGVLHGRLSWRWGPSERLLAAARRLQGLPKQFGDWELQEPGEDAPDIVATLECAGYVQGRYVNRQTGEQVRAALLVGPCGPMSVHLPEICYSGADYQVVEDRKHVTIPEGGRAE